MCRDTDHGGRRCGSTKAQSLARKSRRTKALLAAADPQSDRAKKLTDKLLAVNQELQTERVLEQRLRAQEESAPRFAYTVPPRESDDTANNVLMQTAFETAVPASDEYLDWETIEGILSSMSDGYKDKSREEMLGMLFESGFYAQEHWGDISTLVPVASVLKQRVVNKILNRLDSVADDDLFDTRPDLAQRLDAGEDAYELRRLAVSGLVGEWADHYSRGADGSSTGNLDHFQAAADFLAQRGPNALEDEPGETAQERVARAFIFAQYQETQEFFSNAGITQLLLHRGMSWGADDDETIFDNIPEWAAPDPELVSHLHEVPLSGLSSFTTSKPTAEFFARHTTGGRDSGLGTVISGTVPVSRIISTPMTGLGCLAEREVVIMQGEGNWQVGSNYGDPLRWEEFMEQQSE